MRTHHGDTEARRKPFFFLLSFPPCLRASVVDLFAEAAC